jgi:hypothetical protein
VVTGTELSADRLGIKSQSETDIQESTRPFHLVAGEPGVRLLDKPRRLESAGCSSLIAIQGIGQQGAHQLGHSRAWVQQREAVREASCSLEERRAYRRKVTHTQSIDPLPLPLNPSPLHQSERTSVEKSAMSKERRLRTQAASQQGGYGLR